MSPQKESQRSRQRSDSSLAKIAAEYDRSEVEADYPIPDDEIEIDDSPSRLKTAKNNLKNDFLGALSSVAESANRILNHSETLKREFVVSKITDIKKQEGSDGEIEHLLIYLRNNRRMKYKWKFNEEHSTTLQRFVDYYADGHITKLKGKNVFINEHGRAILPSKYSSWFTLTNHLRPYNLTHPVGKDFSNTAPPEQRTSHHPHYDFGHDTYLTVIAGLTIMLPIVLALVYSTTGSVLLSIGTYLVFHALTIPVSVRSDNGNGPVQFFVPWVMTIVAAITLAMETVASVFKVAEYLYTLPNERE